jgi:hypothetical protein
MDSNFNLKASRWIKDLKNSTNDEGIKYSIDQLTHTIGTLGAIRVPNEENRYLLVNAAVVNRLASEATTDI